MANLIRTKYESDTGEIHPMRLYQATIDVGGPAPAAEVTNSILATVSKTNREAGLRARGVRLAQLRGAAPNQFYRYQFIPVLTPALFNGGNFEVGQTLAYKGTDWTIVARLGEDV